MFFKVALSLLIIFFVLIAFERLTRINKLKTDYARKLIHICVASFVAFWPYYLNYRSIELIALAFIVVILLSRQFKIFKSIHKVHHKTIGDLIFPVSILVLALVGPAKPIFMVAFLIMGLSDGLAGMAGIRFGKSSKDKNQMSNQPFISSLVFFAVTLVVLTLFKLVDPHGIANLTWWVVLILPIVAALVENLSLSGSDDLTVPLVIFVVLRWL